MCRCSSRPGCPMGPGRRVGPGVINGTPDGTEHRAAGAVHGRHTGGLRPGSPGVRSGGDLCSRCGIPDRFRTRVSAGRTPVRVAQQVRRCATETLDVQGLSFGSARHDPNERPRVCDSGPCRSHGLHVDNDCAGAAAEEGCSWHPPSRPEQRSPQVTCRSTRMAELNSSSVSRSVSESASASSARTGGRACLSMSFSPGESPCFS